MHLFGFILDQTTKEEDEEFLVYHWPVEHPHLATVRGLKGVFLASLGVLNSLVGAPPTYAAFHHHPSDSDLKCKLIGRHPWLVVIALLGTSPSSDAVLSSATRILTPSITALLPSIHTRGEMSQPHGPSRSLEPDTLSRLDRLFEAFQREIDLSERPTSEPPLSASQVSANLLLTHLGGMFEVSEREEREGADPLAPGGDAGGADVCWLGETEQAALEQHFSPLYRQQPQFEGLDGSYRYAGELIWIHGILVWSSPAIKRDKPAVVTFCRENELLGQSSPTDALRVGAVAGDGVCVGVRRGVWTIAFVWREGDAGGGGEISLGVPPTGDLDPGTALDRRDLSVGIATFIELQSLVSGLTASPSSFPTLHHLATLLTQRPSSPPSTVLRPIDPSSSERSPDGAIGVRTGLQGGLRLAMTPKGTVTPVQSAKGGVRADLSPPPHRPSKPRSSPSTPVLGREGLSSAEGASVASGRSGRSGVSRVRWLADKLGEWVDDTRKNRSAKGSAARGNPYPPNLGVSALWSSDQARRDKPDSLLEEKTLIHRIIRQQPRDDLSPSPCAARVPFSGSHIGLSETALLRPASTLHVQQPAPPSARDDTASAMPFLSLPPTLVSGVGEDERSPTPSLPPRTPQTVISHSTTVNQTAVSGDASTGRKRRHWDALRANLSSALKDVSGLMGGGRPSDTAVGDGGTAVDAAEDTQVASALFHGFLKDFYRTYAELSAIDESLSQERRQRRIDLLKEWEEQTTRSSHIALQHHLDDFRAESTDRGLKPSTLDDEQEATRMAQGEAWRFARSIAHPEDLEPIHEIASYVVFSQSSSSLLEQQRGSAPTEDAANTWPKPWPEDQPGAWVVLTNHPTDQQEAHHHQQQDKPDKGKGERGDGTEEDGRVGVFQEWLDGGPQEGRETDNEDKQGEKWQEFGVFL